MRSNLPYSLHPYIIGDKAFVGIRWRVDKRGLDARGILWTPFHIVSSPRQREAAQATYENMTLCDVDSRGEDGYWPTYFFVEIIDISTLSSAPANFKCLACLVELDKRQANHDGKQTESKEKKENWLDGVATPVKDEEGES